MEPSVGDLQSELEEAAASARFVAQECPEPTPPPSVPDWPKVAGIPDPRVCKAFECTAILGEGVESDLCAVHRRMARGAYEATGMLGRDVLDAMMGAPGKCARKGCERDRVTGSVWCAAHAACDASVSCDNLPVVGAPEMDDECSCVDDDGHGAKLPPEGCAVHGGQEEAAAVAFDEMDEWAQRLMAEAYEFAWQAIAEDSNNDPVTVARCKRVHDMQLRDLGVSS
jgi:hypothetical protein